jgi:hypothetical protein
MVFRRYTKADGIEIRPLQNTKIYNLENVHITTATLIKFAQEISTNQLASSLKFYNRKV